MFYVAGEDNIVSSMEAESSCVPPGFRFHPTEEELVGYYLHRKINSLKIDLDVIVEVDLYSIEPWDLQGTHMYNLISQYIHKKLNQHADVKINLYMYNIA